LGAEMRHILGMKMPPHGRHFYLSNEICRRCDFRPDTCDRRISSQGRLAGEPLEAGKSRKTAGWPRLRSSWGLRRRDLVLTERGAAVRRWLPFAGFNSQEVWFDKHYLTC
jgi:hypothetical protein